MYTDDGFEENFTIREHGMHMMPSGYHTIVSAPGYMTYFLWVLAGEHRTQGVDRGREGRAGSAAPCPCFESSDTRSPR